MRLTPGTKLGPYEIVAPLGAGGMGEVYRARDARLERDVAIKVLPPRLLDDPIAIARFEREAKAIAALSHPNIVAVHDFQTQDGNTFIVTELLDGEPLRNVVVRGALPWRKAAELSASIAEGLAAAHARDIVHRDLKPENIFITADGRVKILDFGLAKTNAAPTGSQSEVKTAQLATTEGTIMGTVGYMSPEQVRGDVAGTPSDIFSLGCVIYELTTGRRAFERDTAAETMTAILREEPTQPDALSIRVVPELTKIIERCLAKDPRQRFQSASDLAFALRAVASSTSSELMTATPARTWKMPKYGWAAISIAVFVALAAAAAIMLHARSTTINSVAVMPFENASHDPNSDYLSDGITESIINNLSKIHDLRVVPRSTSFHYKGHDPDPQKVAKELGVRGVVTGRVLLRGGVLVVDAELVDTNRQAQLWGEQYNRTLADLLGVQKDISQQISDNLRAKISGEDAKRIQSVSTSNNDAYQMYLKGRARWSRRTREDLTAALELFHGAIEKDPTYALAWVGLADCYVVMGNRDFVPYEEAFTKGAAAAKRALEIAPSLAEPHATLGVIHGLYEHDFAAAGAEFKRAIELAPNYPSAHQWYGMHLQSLGDLDRAAAELKKAATLDPFSPIILASLGFAEFNLRNDDEALTYFRKALAIEPRSFDATNGEATVMEQKKQYAEAAKLREHLAEIVHYEQDAAIWRTAHDEASYFAALRQVYGLAEKNPAASKYELAEMSMRLGENDRAMRQLLEACQIHDGRTMYVKASPIFASLHRDTRWNDLLHCLGLP